ncbi:Hypothetical protein BSM4216_3726 [Bacillus smithii]|jgi:hypothetical protein|nr:Hypothetical protein BSM4216_3726 [Bacillus smithii]
MFFERESKSFSYVYHPVSHSQNMIRNHDFSNETGCPLNLQTAKLRGKIPIALRDKTEGIVWNGKRISCLR